MLLPETIAIHNKAQYEFHTIYFLPWKNQMVQAIKDNGGKVTCLPAKNNVKIILSVTDVAKYVREHKIDIIHCHLPWAGIAGRLAGKMTGVPVIYTEHNKWERYHKFTYSLNKFTFGWQQLVVPVSGDVEQSIRHHYTNPSLQIQTILNGVNTEKFDRSLPVAVDIRAQLGIAAATKVIGTVSVFRVQKRLLTWLEIAHQVHQQHPDTYFIVVGDGPLKEEVHAKAKELKMDGYLHFAGLQEEVRPYFKAMDVFMMASEFEGLPIALLEAMSMECIPCCTKAGGIAEVIEDNKSGVLVDVQQPMALTEKLSYLIQNWDTIAPAMKKNAREKVKSNFSMQRMVAELEAVYTKLARKN
ncbi:MAG: glycosyltransferase [Sphingobacteriales bacterium]|nr:MAG: glycosyltransferase [Sphingobacteriales bacterium]